MPDLVCIKAVEFRGKKFARGDVKHVNRWWATLALEAHPDSLVSVGRATPEKVAAVLEKHKTGRGRPKSA